MSEPEDLLIEGAALATTAVRAMWTRGSKHTAADEGSLEDARGRLTLVLAALFADPLPIVTAQPPAPRSWLARAAARWADRPSSRQPRQACASTDGARIALPRTVPDDVPLPAASWFRAAALEQMMRAQRGTPRLARMEAPLEHDLYALAESVAVDRALARACPGIAGDLRVARAHARRTRPPLQSLTPREAAVERLLNGVLESPPTADAGAVPLLASPAASLIWAKEMARTIERAVPGRYRGIAPVSLWGTISGPTERIDTLNDTSARSENGYAARRTARLRRVPRERRAAPGEDDPRPGTWIVRADDPQESVEDPLGLARPADRDRDAAPDELADALADLPEARVVRTLADTAELLLGDAPPPRATVPVAHAAGTGVVYPEWDWRSRSYRTDGAIVRDCAAASGAESWVHDARRRQAPLVRQVRRQFQRLRPERVRLRRQRDGADVDIDAYVSAHADGHRAARSTAGARHAADDRLYVDVRRVRRELAFLLLVDVSASTDSWVSARSRVVDVEKDALVVLCEALDGLGDPYAILSFSGTGPRAVGVGAVKRFDEAAGMAVQRRIAALEPERFTRTGAAIRHATVALVRQPARHRLLLLLSDGKPNDVDEYEGRYGVEDTRQAAVEARLQGVHPFCLTVDRDASGYVPHIFGPGNYAILPRAERLPAALVALVHRLVRR